MPFTFLFVFCCTQKKNKLDSARLLHACSLCLSNCTIFPSHIYLRVIKILAKNLTQWPMCQFLVVIEIEKLKIENWNVKRKSVFFNFQFFNFNYHRKLTHWPLCQFFCQNLYIYHVARFKLFYTFLVLFPLNFDCLCLF